MVYFCMSAFLQWEWLTSAGREQRTSCLTHRIGVKLSLMKNMTVGQSSLLLKNSMQRNGLPLQSKAVLNML